MADHVLAIAQAMTARKENVVSLLQVPTPRSGEVLLEVKFADVDRSTLSQFGANLLSTSPAKNVFTTTHRAVFTPHHSIGSNSHRDFDGHDFDRSQCGGSAHYPRPVVERLYLSLGH